MMDAFFGAVYMVYVDNSSVLQIRVRFFSQKYVACTQKNRLSETVLSSTRNMFKLMGKKI